MRHPFEAIPRAARRRVFLPSLAAALLVLIAWVITVAPMSTEEAPLSVSSFGTAWSLRVRVSAAVRVARRGPRAAAGALLKTRASGLSAAGS